MTTSTRRPSNPVAEVLSWFDHDAPFALRTDGTPLVRIEDYVEDGTYVLRCGGPGARPGEGSRGHRHR